MPIKYAIASKRTDPLSRDEIARLRARGYRSFEMPYLFEEVPAIVADMDEQNGRYALFSEHDVKLSDWLPVKKTAEVEEAKQLGAKKRGAALVDSVQQPLNRGDYVFTHSNDHRTLELFQVVRNLKTKVVVEMLTDAGYEYSFNSSPSLLYTRRPDTFIRIPTALIEGGEVTPARLEKRFVMREIFTAADGRERPVLVPVNETVATENGGRFGYFINGELVSGWIQVDFSQYDQKSLDAEYHAQKRILKTPVAPMSDAMGTAINLGDFVFSNDNHHNNFMLCEVIGFTKERVRLLGYQSAGTVPTGWREFTLNWPKNIVKFPLEYNTQS